MRTTIRIDSDLLREAKQLAAETGQSFTAIVEEALRERLYRRRLAGPKEEIALVTTGQGGPLPGVDLDDSAALYDRMEEPD